MKIAVPVNIKDVNAEVAEAFGRASYFAVLENENYSYIENTQNLNAVQGAGIQSAQNLINEDINVLITRHLGPKAVDLLNRVGIKVYHAEKGSVYDAVKSYLDNKLPLLEKADVEGHWS